MERLWFLLCQKESAVNNQLNKYKGQPLSAVFFYVHSSKQSNEIERLFTFYNLPVAHAIFITVDTHQNKLKEFLRKVSETKIGCGTTIRGGDNKMNELKKSNINQMVVKYLSEKDQAILDECYNELSKEYRKWINYRSKSTFMANHHDILAIFDDAFIGVLSDIADKGGDFVKLFQLRLTSRYNSFLRKLVKRRDKEKFIISEIKNGEEEAATFEIADEYRFEEHIGAKQKADQLALIDFLVCGENSRTTAIVQAYLSHPKPNATAIAKEIGLDHKQVSRALKSLAGKFSTKQFGNYEDYLIAL